MSRGRRRKQRQRGTNKAIRSLVGTPSSPTIQRQITEESYSGLIPHPGMLKAYDDIPPGLADRLVTRFEEQGRHREKMETKHLGDQTTLKARGQNFATIIVLASLAVSASAFYFKYPVSGVLVTSGGLAVIVTAFLRGGDSTK